MSLLDARGTVTFSVCHDCLTGRCSLGSDCPCPHIEGVRELDGTIHRVVEVAKAVELSLDTIHEGCFCTWRFDCKLLPVVSEDADSTGREEEIPTLLAVPEQVDQDGESREPL